MEKYGHLEWSVAYEPGVLEAVGYRNGREIMRERRVTAGEAAKIQLSAEQSAPGSDVYLIHALLTDERGVPAPTACNELTFTPNANCALLGLGNGDPASKEDQQFAQKTIRQEVLSWRRTENGATIPWNAFQMRGGDHYFDRLVSHEMVRMDNYEPFRDPFRVIPTSAKIPCTARFETTFYAEDTRFDQLYFERLEGRHTVKLNGEVIGAGDAKGYPCAFDIALKAGENRLEVECSDNLDAGGIYRGVWLTRKTDGVWTRSAYNSRALAVVRKTGDAAKITVSGDDLEAASVTF